ncbi:DUF2116 family Zn-ribbon domain-containing protein [Undibacterium sp. Ji42W]|uniref:DUF2116 family Zn-ribbon domain-containing protein n=1 Tax=Undibacterium sp. Ji42W TaxID=3413039 RepID=UPI003BF1FC54
MSDVADSSDKLIEVFTSQAISFASRDHYVQSNGHCLFCDEAISHDEQFCNTDCRDDFDKEQAALIRNGRRSL